MCRFHRYWAYSSKSSQAQDAVLLSKWTLLCLFPPSTSYIFIHIKFTHVICVIEISPGGPHQMGVRPLCRAPQSLVQQSCDDHRPQQGPLSTEFGSTGFSLFPHFPEHWRAHSRQKSCSKMHKQRHFYYQMEIISQRIKQNVFLP